MSNTRLKLIATASPEELEAQANDFLARDDIELKQLDYQTDGYEKPYSVAMLYHEKGEQSAKEQTGFWRKRIFGKV